MTQASTHSHGETRNGPACGEYSRDPIALTSSYYLPMSMHVERELSHLSDPAYRLQGIMEAFSNLEERLSTKEAFVLLGFITFAVTGIGVAVLLHKVRRKWMLRQEQQEKGVFRVGWPEQSRTWAAIKNALMGSLRWSSPNKWDERYVRRQWEERPMPLLALEGYGAEIIGWQSHNSESPVWQRPILMGEKCQLPGFSGLILYDEQGRQLHDSYKETTHHLQEKAAPVMRTTLKDLL